MCLCASTISLCSIQHDKDIPKFHQTFSHQQLNKVYLKLQMLMSDWHQKHQHHAIMKMWHIILCTYQTIWHQQLQKERELKIRRVEKNNLTSILNSRTEKRVNDKN